MQKDLHHLLKFRVFRRIDYLLRHAQTRMSKPAKQCAFCGRTGATKSHIWPDWLKNILTPSATHHERIVGRLETFEPKMGMPPLQATKKQGHVGSRKPRNTCGKCNGGWMREIEETNMSLVPPLLLGHPHLLQSFGQRLLATFLCLVSMRIEISSVTVGSIPKAERDWLKQNYEPPANWRIWIARYKGEPLMDERFAAMQIASKTVKPSIEHCNSQVTTLVIGQLCAHLFSSTVWPNFGGYEGIQLCSIWPPSQFGIDTSAMPVITQTMVPWLHEAIGRELSPP
jgi:hypothetical protein